jgi:uncharacterized DUF497 family protein
MLRFQWDPAKSAANERKHGVSFDEAQGVFYDPMAVVIPDAAHSTHEDRYRILGMTGRLRVLTVVFVEVDADEVRLISARRATRTEQEAYEAKFRKS